MSLSASSLLTCNLTVLLSVAILYWMRKKGNYSLINISVLIVFLLLSTLRLTLPVEFPFTKTIFITEIFPPLIRFLYEPRDLGPVSLTLWDLFFAVWIIGCIIESVRFFFSYCRFATFMSRAVPFEQPLPKSVLNRLESDGLLSDRHSFYRLPAGTSPCCTGVFKCKIFLPDSTFTEEELYYVLRHELAHCRSHDLFSKTILEIIRIFQWWNPLVFWIRNTTFQLIEMRADKMAIQGFTKEQIADYASCLLKCAYLERTHVSLSQTNLHGERTSDLTVRCKMILEEKSDEHMMRNQIKDLSIIGIAFFFCFISLGIVVNVTSDMPSDQIEPGFFTSTEDSFYAVRINQGYEFYVNGELQGIMATLPDSLSIPVYSTIKEVPE